MYNDIVLNTKHKNKIIKFEFFLTSNLVTILFVLKNRKYCHGKYNVFLISDPKYRIIMSENVSDKIVNRLVSKYFLFPVLEKKLISSNVATRYNKGTKAGIYYIKKYINRLKENYDNFYVLKCDVHKFFYSIDHDVLINMLYKIYDDKNIMDILISIIRSTDREYVNDEIRRYINKEKDYIYGSNLTKKEKILKLKELDRIPLYENGKGLPIGNMSSQILAIFYLNDLDHFVKEKLGIKCYVRYMDDMILFHHDREYLKYCLSEISKKLSEVKLNLNNKTQLNSITNGVNFLGYRFVLKGKKLIIKINSNTKKRFVKSVKKMSIKERERFLDKYNGYMINADTKGLLYNLKFYSIIDERE